MPTAAELSPTQRRWVVKQSGFDPSTHELDDNGFIKPIRVATAPSVSDNDFPHPKVEPSAPEAPGFTETAIHSAINAAPAAAIGSSAAALVAPWSTAVAQIPHPLAKLAYLIPPAVGAIAGGLEHYGQTKLQEEFTPEDLAKLQAMQQANPWGARVGGGAAMMVGGFNPNPLNVARAAGSLGKVISKPLTGINLTAPELQNLANVGVGTGVGTGITAAQNLVTGRPIEEGLGEAALTSALFNSPNAIGRRMGFKSPVDLNIHPTRDDLVNGTPVVAPPAEVAPQTPIDINAYLAAGNEIQTSAPIASSITPESVMANLFPGQTIASRAVKQTTPRSPIFAADPELQLLNAQGQIPEPSTAQPITRYKTVQPPAKSAEASWRDIEMLKRENAPVEQRLRLTDYLRAMREKQAQDDAALLQAASTQQQQLTAQKLQVGADLLNQQKAQHEADIAALQAAMRGNQLGGVEVAPKPLVETPLGKEIYPDYTGVKEANNAEIANPPPIDIEAEAIQDKLSKYSEGGALRPQTEAEKQANERLNAAGIQLTPTEEWNAKMQNVAAYRGQKLTTDKPVRNAQGQEMAGMATGREAFVSPTKGQIVTAPHEMQGHNFVNDLRNSKNASDRKLAADYDAFTASNPEFHAINAERAKQGLEPWTPEEFNANNAGAEYVMDRLGLRNEGEFKTWWKDIASHYKTKQGGANAADFQRVLNYKFVNDAPFNPANYTGVGGKTQFSEGQPKSADRVRYEEIQKSIMDHVMRDDTDSPEFTKLWQESEDIKNRNGGNPPKYSEGDALRKDDLVPGEQEILDKQLRIWMEKYQLPLSKRLDEKSVEDFSGSLTGFAKNVAGYSKMSNTVDNRQTIHEKVAKYVTANPTWAQFLKDKELFPSKHSSEFNDMLFAVVKPGAKPTSIDAYSHFPWFGANDKIGEIRYSKVGDGKIYFSSNSKEGDKFLADTQTNKAEFDEAIKKPGFVLAKYSTQFHPTDAGISSVTRDPEVNTLAMNDPEIAQLEQQRINLRKRYGAKYSEGDALRSPEFKLTTQKELEKDKPFGLQVSRNGTVESKQLRAKLNSLPASEQEMLRMSGVDELMKLPAVSVKELREHLAANAPKVEVHSYGMEGKVSEAKKEYDRMTHEWYETMSRDDRSIVNGYMRLKTTDPKRANDYIEEALNRKINVDKVRKYAQLHDQAKLEESSTPRATQYYSTVSALPADQPMPDWTVTKSKKNVQRVDVVIPLKQVKHEPGVDWNKYNPPNTAKGETMASEVPKWSPDNLHENLPNTLGWAMIQYKTGPNGEKIAVIAEAQSRWGQERRASEQAHVVEETGGDYNTWMVRHKEKGYVSSGHTTKASAEEARLAKIQQDVGDTHPLLRDYNRLILKAAIDQARKEGATHVMVSDAETAMMTEGHDAYGVKSKQSFDTWDDAIKHAMELQGDTARYTPHGNPAVHGKYASLYPVQEEGKWKLISNPDATEPRAPGLELSQEPGMRLNYDTILPKIAEELTGSKGERVSLGEHKNAFEYKAEQRYADGVREQVSREAQQRGVSFEEVMAERSARDKQPRSNLIFRNPDGTPKTDVSGRMYPIEGTSLAARREAGEPFSLTAPKYSEGDALRSEAKRPTKQPWITPLVASEIQKIERIRTPRAKAAANAVREFYRVNSRNRGQLETSFIRDVITARPWELSAKGLAEWAKMDTPENQHVVSYLNDMSDTGKSEVKLTPVEQKIADSVRSNLLKSKAMMESFKSAGDIEGLAHGTSADPNYFPNLMSRRASRVIAETPDSPEAMQMHKDFIEYNMKKGRMTEAEAEDKWALLKGGYAQQKAQLAQQFGPIDKLAGVGLPRSMRETNLFDIMSRFNRRYARRLAYHEAIERNTNASDALFNPKNGLEANKEVKNVLEDIYGVREHNEDIRRAATGIIRAGMMGTLAGVKDFTTNMVLGMQHMDMDQPIPSLVHAFETAKENYRKAQDTGVVRYNFAGVEQGEGGFTDVIHWLDRARDIANTAQGRALLENGARTIAMGQGQFLAREALHALANKKLTTQKRKFLDDFVPNWENYKTTAAPDAVITEAAARFVESVQGTYDYRGLPSIAMRGTLAPYLSLARWNIEKFNNFMQHTIEPARNGNWTPLLMSTIGMLIGGAAVEQIVELAQHKKSKLPEVSEIEAAKEEEQWKLAGYKLAGYASMSGYAGVLADVVKIGADTAYKNRVNTYNNPLIEGLTTATEDIGQLAEAIAKNDVASVASIIGTFLEDFSQTYRIANAQLNPEKQKANERSDKYRDLKLFNMGQGNDLADSGDTRPNPFLSPETKQFKQTSDVEEAKRLGKELIAKAVKKANGDPEVLMAELSKLKHNSYQTMPSPDTLPAKFVKYYNWLVKTQGQAKADEVKADYIRQNALNRAKSGMIP